MKPKQLTHRFRWILRNLPLFICLVLIPNIVVVLIFTDSLKFITNRGLKPNKLSNAGVKYANVYQNSFDIMYKSCLYSDEIQPKYRTCVNYSGFGSSIVESLSTLYLLGLKPQYDNARKFVFENFNTDTLGWVNTHEFWSRGIGSLIETFLITKDKSYFELAKKCAFAALQLSPLSSPYDFINFKTKERKTNQWTNGNIVSDLWAGAPELIVIAKLSNDQKLLENISLSMDSYNTINGNIYQKIPLAYNASEQRVSVSLSEVNGFNIGYIHNLLLSLALHNEISFEDAIKKHLSTMNLPPNILNETFFRILDFEDFVEKLSIGESVRGFDQLSKDVFKLFLSHPYEGYKASENRKYSFTFNSSPLRFIMKKLLSMNDNKGKADIENLLQSVLTYSSASKGVVGLITTRRGNSVKGKTMPSNFFGQWSLAAALYYNGYDKIIQNGIFNDRGHLIMSEELHSFSRDPIS